MGHGQLCKREPLAKKSSELLYPAVSAAHTANSEGLSVRKGEHYKYMQGCHIPDSWKCVENEIWYRNVASIVSWGPHSTTVSPGLLCRAEHLCYHPNYLNNSCNGWKQWILGRERLVSLASEGAGFSRRCAHELRALWVCEVLLLLLGVADSYILGLVLPWMVSYTTGHTSICTWCDWPQKVPECSGQLVSLCLPFSALSMASCHVVHPWSPGRPHSCSSGRLSQRALGPVAGGSWTGMLRERG